MGFTNPAFAEWFPARTNLELHGHLDGPRAGHLIEPRLQTRGQQRGGPLPDRGQRRPEVVGDHLRHLQPAGAQQRSVLQEELVVVNVAGGLLRVPGWCTSSGVLEGIGRLLEE